MPDSRHMQAAAALLDQLLPCSCVICLASTRSPLPGLCSRCEEMLPAIGPVCGQCSLPLPGLASSPARLQELARNGDLRCGQCLRRPPPIDNCRAAFLYRAPLPAMLGRFKYQTRFIDGRVLAELFARQHAEAMLRDPPQVLLAVPLHWRKRVARGFNQSEWLSSALSRATAIPNARLLRRTRATANQQGLALEARPHNVRGAFQLRKQRNIPAHIAVIDDVITSMATMNEIARVLKSAGVQRVDAYCLARTELL